MFLSKVTMVDNAISKAFGGRRCAMQDFAREKHLIHLIETCEMSCRAVHESESALEYSAWDQKMRKGLTEGSIFEAYNKGGSFKN